MAESSWPTPDNSRDVTDLQYEQMMAGYVPSGMVGSPGDTSTVYASGDGRQVYIRLGKYGYVRGHPWYSGTSNFTKAIAANASGNPRIDLVVLRLTRSTWNVTSAIVQGTPAAVPAVPALTQDLGSTGVFEIPIATVAVANGASVINSGDVTAKDFYLGRSSLIGIAANMPLSGTYIGQTYQASDTGVTYRWTGTLWVPNSPGLVGTKFHTETFTWVTGETAMTAWHASSDANVTFQNGGMYRLEYAAGYSTAAGFLSAVTVRVRKTVNSTSSAIYQTWQLSKSNSTRDDVTLVGYLKNASGADIVTSLGITGQSADGTNHNLIGDATTPAVLNVYYVGLSSGYAALAAAATSIT